MNLEKIEKFQNFENPLGTAKNGCCVLNQHKKLSRDVQGQRSLRNKFSKQNNRITDFLMSQRQLVDRPGPAIK